jgi:acyl-CoA thioesterase FadM
LLGHVNNVTYVRWVRRMRLGDEIVARTWVGSACRVRFERFTELLRAGGRTLLAKARTMWCPIDAQKHPGRMSVTGPARPASHALEGDLS